MKWVNKFTFYFSSINCEAILGIGNRYLNLHSTLVLLIEKGKNHLEILQKVFTFYFSSIN